ncbi:MAG: P-loop NTPase [Actinomycetota bacterium]
MATISRDRAVGAPGPTPPTADEVRDVLRSVIDPELGADIVSLGMVGSIVIGDDGLVTIEVKLTISGCPMRAEIKREVEDRVELHPGVTKVKIEWGEMTADERTEVMTRARWNARERATATKVPTTTKVLAIASGKGGVGKSSVTVNLAAALAAHGLRVGVLDADIWGFSVPRLLGITDRMEAERIPGHDKPLIIPNRRPVPGAIVDGEQRPDGVLEVVSTGFLVDEDTALMWRGLMLTKAVEQFLNDVLWGDLDYLLIDMPPGTGDVQMGLARMLPATDLLVVTTPALAAQKVAQRAADMARRSFLKVIGVVENMSAFTDSAGVEHALFGAGGGAALAEAIDTPLLGSIPIEPAVSAGGDAGEPVALDGSGVAAEAFRSIARRLIEDLAPPAERDDDGQAVDMAGCSARLLDAVAAAFDD